VNVFVAIFPTPNINAGITNVGITIMDINVRRSRSESFNSFR